MLPIRPFCVLVRIVFAPHSLIRLVAGESSPSNDLYCRRRGKVPIVAPIIPHPRRLCQVPPPFQSPKTPKSRTFTGGGGQGGWGATSLPSATAGRCAGEGRERGAGRATLLLSVACALRLPAFPSHPCPCFSRSQKRAFAFAKARGRGKSK